MAGSHSEAQCISLKQAADIAGKSESTEHGLGRRIGGGTWSISRVALAMLLDGQEGAEGLPRGRPGNGPCCRLFRSGWPWRDG